jgi:hypothetical protein
MIVDPPRRAIYRFEGPEVLALTLGGAASFVISNFLFKIYRTPCAIADCAALFNYSYMPIKRLEMELLKFGFQSEVAESYMFAIWLSAIYFLLWFFIVGIYRAYNIPPLIRQQLAASQNLWKNSIVGFASSLCIIIGVWWFVHFEDRFSIYTLSLRLPIAYSLIVLEILALGAAWFFGQRWQLFRLLRGLRERGPASLASKVAITSSPLPHQARPAGDRTRAPLSRLRARPG